MILFVRTVSLIQKRLRQICYRRRYDLVAVSQNGLADSEAIETFLCGVREPRLPPRQNGLADSEAIETLYGQVAGSVRRESQNGLADSEAIET